jgi:hypothetical protein
VPLEVEMVVPLLAGHEVIVGVAKGALEVVGLSVLLRDPMEDAKILEGSFEPLFVKEILENSGKLEFIRKGRDDAENTGMVKIGVDVYEFVGKIEASEDLEKSG